MWGSKDGRKNQAKQDQLTAATPAVARVSRLRSMRQPRSNTRRLRDSRHAGLCGVAMAFDHVMILQLV
jgi:hypothetical protein